MILSEEYLQSVLDEALARMDVPAGCAALLEGSIAAGFGNSSSDIDFLLIEDGEWEHLTMPTVLFVDDRRVEVRLRSLRQIRQQAEAVLARAAAGGAALAKIPEDLLNRCQRLSCAYPLRAPELAELAKNTCSGVVLEQVIAAWFRHRARQSTRRAVAMSALRQSREAIHWARTGILQGAKSWLAGRGETYLERKWVSQQLARTPDEDGVKAAFWTLLGTGSGWSPERAEQYVRDCAALNGRFGVDACGYRPELISLSPAPAVTTWPIGDRVHVLRQRRDVFVLGPGAARVWRSLVFRAPLPMAFTAQAEPATAGRLVVEFERLGLIRMTWQRAGIAGPPPMTPPPGISQPVLSLDGAVCDGAGALGESADTAVERVPLTPARFVSAGMSLVWTNVMLENAREDLVGAIDHGQWGTVAAAANRMLRQACLSLLCAYGFSPAPSAEEAATLVARVRAVPAGIRKRVVEIEDRISVRDGDSARAALDDVDDLVRRMREVTGVTAFPSSFVSAAQWRRTLELGYDWARLGGYLSADFPLQEARDLIAAAGTSPQQARAADTVPAH